MTEVKIRDIISPNFYSVHKAVRENKYTHYYLKGGRGSTKSSFVGIEIPIGLMKDPNANAVVLRKVSKYIHSSVYEQIMWGIYTLGIEEYWDNKVAPMEIIYLPTGQRIVFRGADDPKKIKSTKFRKGYCKYVWYEELDEFTPEDVRSINQTLLRGGEKFNVFYSYNPPKSIRSWVNEEVLTERPDRLIHHSTYLTVPKHWLGEQFFIEAEHLKKTKPQTYSHEYLGEVTGTGGEVFANVKCREITDEEIKRFDGIRCGLDFGYAIDPTHYTEMHFDKTRKRLYIFFEIHQAGLKNRQAVDLIKKQNKNNNWITADSSEPRTIDEMRDIGLNNIKGAYKAAGSVEHGIKYLQDLEEIIIDPQRCPNTAREFTQYELNKDKNGNFTAKFSDKNNHSIDATRYALEDDMRASSISFLK